MARKKREPEAKPAAGWITTFSDLMNLLLCFFVLLFSMSTVDAEKFQMVIASLQSSLSIMPAGSMMCGPVPGQDRAGNPRRRGLNQPSRA